jgi:hypothetical protein
VKLLPLNRFARRTTDDAIFVASVLRIILVIFVNSSGRSN